MCVVINSENKIEGKARYCKTDMQIRAANPAQNNKVLKTQLTATCCQKQKLFQTQFLKLGQGKENQNDLAVEFIIHFLDAEGKVLMDCSTAQTMQIKAYLTYVRGWVHPVYLICRNNQRQTTIYTLMGNLELPISLTACLWTV